MGYVGERKRNAGEGENCARRSRSNAGESEGCVGGSGRIALSVETASGVCPLSLNVQNGKVMRVTAALGKASFEARRVADTERERICGLPMTVCGREAYLTLVHVGNPHAVLFFESIEGLSPASAAKELAACYRFPHGVNVEIAECVARDHLWMRVFERGSGETLACGTGASAVSAAAVAAGLCDYGVPIAVSLLGGTLAVTVERDFSLSLTGEAVTVYEGVYDDDTASQ